MEKRRSLDGFTVLLVFVVVVVPLLLLTFDSKEVTMGELKADLGYIPESRLGLYMNQRMLDGVAESLLKGGNVRLRIYVSPRVLSELPEKTPEDHVKEAVEAWRLALKFKGRIIDSDTEPLGDGGLNIIITFVAEPRVGQ